VEVRPVLLDMAIWNILDNAFRYSPEDKPVYLEVHAEEGAVSFTIADAGPGIPAEQREHVFDLGWTGGLSPNDGRRAHGIGLSIVRSIVRTLGGTITLGVSIYGGLKFEVVLFQDRESPALEGLDG